MRSRRTGFVVFLIGMLGLAAVTRQPRFAMFHTVDVLQLLATGMCFDIRPCRAVGEAQPQAARPIKIPLDEILI